MAQPDVEFKTSFPTHNTDSALHDLQTCNPDLGTVAADAQCSKGLECCDATCALQTNTLGLEVSGRTASFTFLTVQYASHTSNRKAALHHAF